MIRTRTLTDPSAPRDSDREAFNVLDDDGNPWHPPEPDVVSRIRWKELARAKLDQAGGVLRRHPALSMGLAFGVAYLLGRVLAGRAS